MSHAPGGPLLGVGGHPIAGSPVVGSGHDVLDDSLLLIVGLLDQEGVVLEGARGERGPVRGCRAGEQEHQHGECCLGAKIHQAATRRWSLTMRLSPARLASAMNANMTR